MISFLFLGQTMKGDFMQVRLGYVSLPLTIPITSSKTMTYTAYLKNKTERLEKLDSIIHSNLESLYEILKYNVKNNIHFFRMTSNLIPLATLPDVSFDYINPYLPMYQKIGDYVKRHHMRIDMHPDQYVILNSMNPSVLENTFRALEYYKKILDAFGFPNPKLVLHVGSSQGGKKSSMTRFCNNFKKLSILIQKMILLENDDKVYTVSDTLSLAERLNIPMVLDYHHYLCNKGEDELSTLLPRIIATWKNQKLPPKMHFSSPKSKLKKEFRSHHDFITCSSFLTFLEEIKNDVEEVDIMIEAKQKDFALFKLVREIKYETNFLFLDETTFLVP